MNSFSQKGIKTELSTSTGVLRQPRPTLPILHSQMLQDLGKRWLKTGFGTLNPYPLGCPKTGIKTGHKNLERRRGVIRISLEGAVH